MFTFLLAGLPSEYESFVTTIDIDDRDNLDASDDIDRDLDIELELLIRMNGLTVDMVLEIDRFYITL
ncbi:hypothetical protein T459_21353 [Capsicum annuum]|uniref:Uncharacterized protein n=1 Tax=Capsicum annuum TaxID=4072 RepID=A0A2G2YWF4_CAPAN|nr:hypothetical protein T459_21353 [Capsicum annuum]